jgi:aspartate/glutamate racemase
MSTRITLIHATPVAIPPVIDAFAHGWPEVETVNLLDDALSRDLARTGALDEAMMKRFETLAAYAMQIGTDAILFTCSAFGEAIEAVAKAASIPILKPNEAMFEAALASQGTVGLLTTFQPSVASMEKEFIDMAEQRRSRVQCETLWVPHAMEALASGDGATHDRLIAEAAPQLAHCDAIMLAQFSMARAQAAVQQVIAPPILTSPASAVAKLKAALS